VEKIPLYTIGHGTRPAEDFLNLLKVNAIAYLIDVRSRPYSRYNPQYNRERLQQFLQHEGITYVFMGDTLGGKPKDPLCYDNNNRVDYTKIKNSAFFKAGIERLKNAYFKNLKAAIMCSESKPLECHRTHLISKVLHEENILITHITEKGEQLNHYELMNGLPGKTANDLFDA
jgi:uncharacterized protein (DUF488 family)